jgi:hypothetical protein
MEPWQERVVTEKSELDARINRLRAVLNNDTRYPLTHPQRDLMNRQLAYMLAYSSTPRDRIELFGGPNGTI